MAALPPEEPGDWDSVILATGPLTSPALAEALRDLTGEDALAFFDAIAPVVYRDSIDFEKAWFQSRYDKGEGRDYINCPLSRDEYAAFIDALLSAEAIAFKDWEADTPYFEGCLPIEVMAGRGAETLAYGPMKPVGLTNPHAPGVRAHAVVQLRQDNALGHALQHGRLPDQAAARRAGARVPDDPGAGAGRVRQARRAAPQHLRQQPPPSGREPAAEGEAAASASPGRSPAARATSRAPPSASLPAASPPPSAAARSRPCRRPRPRFGALLGHITGGAVAETFQPMNVNFGLFPPLADEPYPAPSRSVAAPASRRFSARALRDLAAWL